MCFNRLRSRDVRSEVPLIEEMGVLESNGAAMFLTLAKASPGVGVLRR